MINFVTFGVRFPVLIAGAHVFTSNQHTSYLVERASEARASCIPPPIKKESMGFMSPDFFSSFLHFGLISGLVSRNRPPDSMNSGSWHQKHQNAMVKSKIGRKIGELWPKTCFLAAGKKEYMGEIIVLGF